MSELAFDQIRAALSGQSLFEDKTWQLSPEAWPISPAQFVQLEAIGAACLEFHQALETLYLRSVAGKNLLRNKPLLAPWVADYLDRGKPPELIAHARDPKNRGAFPAVLRPDLLLTDKGFALTELDSVPGGIGLTAFLNRLYGGRAGPPVVREPTGLGPPPSTPARPAAKADAPGAATADARGAVKADAPAAVAPAASPASVASCQGQILGVNDEMITNFYAALAALRPESRNPFIALVVSDEAATYRPEMQWLAQQLQLQGKRVFCMRPEDIFPLGSQLCFDADGNPEKIDVIYRFFELFDLANVKTAKFIFEAWASGEVAITPPMRPFQEEKLTLALFHHHLLQNFWAEALSSRALKLLRELIPPSWVIDPAPLPPGAILDGPHAGGRALSDWRELAGASQKERDLILKISGYHESAWGARSVILGSDCSREEWQEGVEHAVALAPTNLHLLQVYEKPRRVAHRVYERDAPFAARQVDGRLRLCPYYFVIGGQAKLSGALATFCPPDKKIIHGMQDAALLPAKVTG